MPKTGHFVLHANMLPTLTAGRYELLSEHTGLPFPVAPELTHVHVAAPRFTMPTDQILSTFPPANAEGAFSDRLPQIVLKRRTLPWERNPAGSAAVSPVPWLALVVVAEGEAQLSTATPVAQCVTPGTTLFDAADKDVEQGLYLAVTETVVKKIFPCQQDLDLLVHVREVDVNDTELANGDDDGWLAVVLANRLPVYDKAGDRPVRYMACLVNIEGQLPALPPPEPPRDFFQWELAQDWSVLAQVNTIAGPDPLVMGGLDVSKLVLPGAALPRETAPGAPRAVGAQTPSAPAIGAMLDGGKGMKQSTVGTQWATTRDAVAAAAMDPDAKKLVRDTMAVGFRFPIELVAAERVLRFPVLAHWSFTTNEGATFETLMQDIDVGLLGTLPVPKPDPQRPNAEPAPPGKPPAEIVQTGHIGLGHRARRGDAVRAWYRGPCVPFPTTREPATGAAIAHSADQIRRVVPDGREDLSLASAFEIGRLLALSQLSVVSALMRFRSEQFGAGRVRELLEAVLDFALPPFKGERVDLGRFVALQMVDALVKAPDRMIGPQRPVADPGRELKVSGDLDALIATGLGFDLTAVRKAGEQVGLLAAMAQARVPIANEGGIVRFDERALTHLRGALQQELGHALGVALPTRVVPPVRAGRRGAAMAAAAAPDALDALIARAADSPDAADEEEKAP